MCPPLPVIIYREGCSFQERNGMNFPDMVSQQTTLWTPSTKLPKSRWYNCPNKVKSINEISSTIFLKCVNIFHWHLTQTKKLLCLGIYYIFLGSQRPWRHRFFFFWFCFKWRAFYSSVHTWQTHYSLAVANPLFPKLMSWNVLLTADYQVSLVGDRDMLPTWPERKHAHGNECVHLLRGFCKKGGWVDRLDCTEKQCFLIVLSNMQRYNYENIRTGKNKNLRKHHEINNDTQSILEAKFNLS